MNPVETWHAETLGKAACEALKKNGFDARYAGTGAEALSYIESLVKAGTTVGLGGSMTVKELGAPARLESLGARIIDHSAQGLSPEQKMDAMRAELTCDVFLSSTNAITLDGELFNIDGNGNRVAALTFGPKKTVVVAGFNKIVKNLADAEARCRLVSNPMNCRRLDIPTPCARTGYCVDCQSDRRICRAYSILKRRPSRSDFTVVIVGERLGY